jgi:two-component system, response regulator PdtaR
VEGFLFSFALYIQAGKGRAMKEKRYRIAIADDHGTTREQLRAMVEQAGHEVVACCEDGWSLVEACRTLNSPPDLIITDIRMPGMTGPEAAQRISESMQVPFIVTSAFLSAKDPLLQECMDVPEIMGCLTKNALADDQLAISIFVAISRFKKFDQLNREKSEAEQKLAERKLIEQANGIEIKRQGL